MQSGSPRAMIPKDLIGPAVTNPWEIPLCSFKRAEWWHTFLAKWNGISLLREPSFASLEVQLHSDASEAWGCEAASVGTSMVLSIMASACPTKVCLESNCSEGIAPHYISTRNPGFPLERLHG